MNCQLCQKELDAYCQGNLPGNIRTQVENHLKGCERCASAFAQTQLLNRVINEEREIQSNPFLVTRIMEGIESSSVERPVHQPVFMKVLRPAIITTSLAAAVFAGVLLGGFANTSPDRMPAELAMMDDMAIESVSMLSNE